MKTSVLLDEAVSLPVEERARMVDCLLQSLNPPSETLTAEWAAVARRRFDEMMSGKVVPVEGIAVFERIRQRYGK